MDLVMDFLLLAASGAACFYCWVLSKKLKQLTNTEAGLGAGVAALSQSAEDVKRAIADSKRSADEAATRLETLLAAASAKEADLQAVSAQLSEMEKSVIHHAEDAAENYMSTMTPFLEHANAAAEKLIAAVDVSRGQETSALNGASVSKSNSPPIDDADDDIEFVEPAGAKPRPAGKRKSRAEAAA